MPTGHYPRNNTIPELCAEIPVLIKWAKKTMKMHVGDPKVAAIARFPYHFSEGVCEALKDGQCISYQLQGLRPPICRQLHKNYKAVPK
jgi:hypothetical protein